MARRSTILAEQGRRQLERLWRRGVDLLQFPWGRLFRRLPISALPAR